MLLTSHARPFRAAAVAAAAEGADLDFLNGANLAAMTAAGYTFKRATPARLVDDTLFAVDAPRIESGKGLLIEAGRANLMPFPSALASMTLSGTEASAVVADVASTPAGRACIDRWSPNAGAIRRSSVVTKEGWLYRLSGFARLVSGTNSLTLRHANSATGTSTAITATSTRQRFSALFLGRVGGGSVDCGWGHTTGSTTVYELDGLQVELISHTATSGGLATTPVDNGLGAVDRRDPEVCVARRPNWSAISQLIRARTPAAPPVAGVEQVLWQPDRGWNDDALTLYRDSTGAMKLRLTVADAVAATLTLGTPANDAEIGIALNCAAGRLEAAMTGGTLQTSTLSGVTVPVWTHERVGHDAGSNYWNAHVARCKWSTTLIAQGDLATRAAAILAGTEPAGTLNLGATPAPLLVAGRPPTWRVPFRGEPLWRSTVGARATHADSANFISKLWNSLYVPSGLTGGNFIIHDPEYSFSLYWLEDADDLYTLTATNGNFKTGSIPWKSTWNVTTGTDRQFILASLLTGEITEAWQVTVSHGTKTITASRCNRDNFEDTESYRGGVFDFRTSNARATPARGSGTSCLAGMVLPEEIEGGAIKHPLSLVLSSTVTRNTFVRPAYKSDGPQTASDTIPEGIHFHLTTSLATLDARAAAIPSPVTAGEREYARLMARAFAEQGAIGIDIGGFPHFHSEPSTSAGAKWAALGIGSTRTSGNIRFPQDLMRYMILSSSELRALEVPS